MLKAMLFLDGSWLYRSRATLRSSCGDPRFQIDYGKLPGILADKVASQLRVAQDIDIVRSYFFGSYPANFDQQDESLVRSQWDFLNRLERDFKYELELYPLNSKLQPNDKDVHDAKRHFVREEKCVDVALASSLLYLAMLPCAFDIAIAVIGDLDFKPALQRVRQLGKRVAIASIKHCCPDEFSDAQDRSGVKDFDIIWLDDLAEQLKLRYSNHRLECQSEMHKGDRWVETDYWPSSEQTFYCRDCRKQRSLKQGTKDDDERAATEASEEMRENSSYGSGTQLTGRVGPIHPAPGKPHSYIETDDHLRYYFDETRLDQSWQWRDVREGQEVKLEVDLPADAGKAGTARQVRPTS